MAGAPSTGQAGSVDIDRCALVVLSAAGHMQGHLADDDPVKLASDIVGHDSVVPAARALAEGWVADGGSILDKDEQGWPRGLRSLAEAEPLLLWVRGTMPADPREMVAIVGSRQCTPYGREVARLLARQVVLGGGVVVSGGALGIDGQAHSGCLRAGGCTVLVAAGGAGLVYPDGHERLFSQAALRGAVVWEHPPGTRLLRRSFLRRNRLIAAMSGVTVLVEAAERSGALNTGRTAADLGRLVLGVPGRMDSSSSAGVHRAVADGWAALLLSPADLAEMLGNVG